jgi:hypothetical protein
MEIVDIDDWVSFETKVITLGQDVGGKMFPTYNIRVQEFVYRHGDMLYRTWNGRNGRMSHPCAQYAIADMVEAGQTIKSFVRNHRTLLRYIQPYIDGGDTLLQRTYRMALRQCQRAKVYITLRNCFLQLTSYRQRKSAIFLKDVYTCGLRYVWNRARAVFVEQSTSA